MLTRLSALIALGIGGMLAVLPRADAHGGVVASGDPQSLLLSPAPLSGERFSTFYVLMHR
ncbi:MAG: hypothetical protein EOP22_17700 [Hyphomicrobiales bacterium]|nr:MAG: hypothetical protein EOP22_17700 [Hyphomicrobiales bacterium]